MRGLDRRSARLFVMLGLSLVAAVGCGKKGPPLTPFARVPARIEAVDVRRVGEDVFVTFAVPSQNIDVSKPADVRRVEVYAVSTDQPRPPARLLEGAQLVGVVSIEPTGPPGSTPLPPVPVPGTDPPVDRALPFQGDTVTVHEHLELEDLVPQALVVRQVRQPRPAPGGVAAVPPPPPPPKLQRSYVVVGFSGGGRPGPQSTPAVVSLDRGPDAPAAPTVTYTAAGVQVAWESSGGFFGFLLDRQLPIEIPPIEDDEALRRLAASAPAAAPAGPMRYNVYRQLGPDPLQLPGAVAERPRWQRRAPRPMNLQPLDVPQVADVVELERERCYEVRAVRGTGPDTVEGAPSSTMCVRPVDIFPPEAATGLSTVVAEGAISLIWEGSTSPDAAGYIVLRGLTTDAVLLPLTPSPVIETRYIDRTVVAGVKYAYAVVAVDGRVPVPNASAPSERAEDTAR